MERAEGLLQDRYLAGRRRNILLIGPLWPARLMLWLPLDLWVLRCRSRAQWAPQGPGSLLGLPHGLCLLLPYGLQEGQLLGFFLLVSCLVL